MVQMSSDRTQSFPACSHCRRLSRCVPLEGVAYLLKQAKDSPPVDNIKSFCQVDKDHYKGTLHVLCSS